jgi:NAD(P)-dependent dehydrogenase (short-subunit alcohol dehydrogenase family)
VVENNLVVAFAAVRTVVAEPRVTGGDKSVTFISSINALGGFGAPGYSAAKAGLSGLAKALAPRLGADGIRINTLLLGTVRTPNLLDLLRRRGLDERRLDELAGRSAPRRVLSPEDVARAALSLARDFPGMSGVDVVLDNGQTLTR